MTYKKTVWVDQNVERPKTYEFINNSDGSTTLSESFGNVVELGTPVNAVNMNHIEDGIESVAIRIYKNSESYDEGEWVLGTVNGERGIYESLVDNNENNTLTDTSSWLKVKLGGSENLGGLKWSLLPISDINLHLLDGALLQGNGIYAEFVDHIKKLYEDNPNANYFETESNWQQSVASYGVCGKFVYDSVNNTVRLPKVTGFVEGTIDSNALGDLVQAGLPNITGSLGDVVSGAAPDRVTGAFYISAEARKNKYDDQPANTDAYGFNASLSNSIYGRSNTVQPQAIKGYLYMVVATGGKTIVEANIDNIATDLNGKSDVNLENTSSKLADSFLTKLMPDYSGAINKIINTQYTAETNGYIQVYAQGGEQSDVWAEVYIDGYPYGIRHQNSGYTNYYSNMLFRPIAKGSVYTVTHGTSAAFFPLKGGN